MSDPFNWDQSYPVAEAERGKFVRISSQQLSALGVELSATRGRYALLTCSVGTVSAIITEPVSLNGVISCDNIEIDSFTFSNPLTTVTLSSCPINTQTVLYNVSGDLINVREFGSDHFLTTSNVQEVRESTTNSSSSNLAPGASFTGTAADTFGVAGIQVNVYSDEPLRVNVQQSIDGSNWDLDNQYDVPGSIADGRTHQAVSNYVRVIITNLGNITTTVMRLQTVLCPVVEALPQTLTESGKLKLGSSTRSYTPSPENFKIMGPAGNALLLDTEQHLQVRGRVLTDELSFLDDFNNGHIYRTITGTSYFRNGQTHIIGSGTQFLTEVSKEDYIKLDVDGESYYTRIENVVNDTDIVLEGAYGGTTSSGAAHTTPWTYLSASGGEFAQSSSELTIKSGDVADELLEAKHEGDYLPYSFFSVAKISQRIANQECGIGLADDIYGLTNNQALIVFNGTDNTKVTLRTSNDAASLQETIVTIPSGGTTAEYHEYKIDIISDHVVLWIDEYKLATHCCHIPKPYSLMDIRLYTQNIGAPASSTTLTVDVIQFANFNRLSVSLAPQVDSIITREQYCANGTTTTVAAVSADTILCSQNINRLGLTVFNNSTSVLYLKLGTGASPTSFTTKMGADDYYELPFHYIGTVHGYWASPTGDAQVTELT